MIPLLAFGAHCPEQVMFQKTLRKPETENPIDVVWVPERLLMRIWAFS